AFNPNVDHLSEAPSQVEALKVGPAVDFAFNQTWARTTLFPSRDAFARLRLAEVEDPKLQAAALTVATTLHAYQVALLGGDVPTTFGAVKTALNEFQVLAAGYFSDVQTAPNYDQSYARLALLNGTQVLGNTTNPPTGAVGEHLTVPVNDVGLDVIPRPTSTIVALAAMATNQLVVAAQEQYETTVRALHEAVDALDAAVLRYRYVRVGGLVNRLIGVTEEGCTRQMIMEMKKIDDLVVLLREQNRNPALTDMLASAGDTATIWTARKKQISAMLVTDGYTGDDGFGRDGRLRQSITAAYTAYNAAHPDPTAQLNPPLGLNGYCADPYRNDIFTR
ncbi:MAG: hypothetical protein RR417_07510, partial [Kiritimatiellia bacterium]